jgi:outer membrane protein assembly factor BamB
LRYQPVLIAILVTAVWVPAAPPRAPAPELNWSMFGGSPSRNMVNLTTTGLSHEFPIDDITDEKPHVLGSRIKWKATLGSRSYSQPIVVGGRILIGTNNDNPRNRRDRGKPTDDDPDGPAKDKGILMCFSRADGKFLWQMVHDKLETGQVNDWPHEGMVSTPTVEGNRAYYTSNRCEVVCLDLNGFDDGNQGFQKEQYRDDIDGDVIWTFDLMKELKVFPHNMSICSPVIVGDLLFVITANGVDENHLNVTFPEAPSFVCLNKTTGKLVWSSNLPGRNIMHGQWSSPAYGIIGGVPQVIFPAGDGWLYAFDPPSGKLLWKFDCNPKGSVYELGAKGTKSDFIALPVIYKEKIFIGTGQDPEHLEGVGHFWCIDPAGRSGDISAELVIDAKAKPPRSRPNPNNGAVWHYGGVDTRPYSKRDNVFSRTISTACIVDDIVYIAELAGYVQCLDARTGKKYWQWDTKSNIWGSCYYVDGKVLVANEDGDLYFFKHEKNPAVIDEMVVGSAAAVQAERQAQAAGLDVADTRRMARDAYDEAVAAVREQVKARYLLQVVELGEAIRSSPVVVGDTLYLNTEKTLYAVTLK